MTTTSKSMSVKLATFGGIGATEKPTVAMGDWAAASAAVREYIGRHGIGAKDWKGGEVRDLMGKAIARVSYNGKVWDTKADGATCLYDPSAR